MKKLTAIVLLLSFVCTISLGLSTSYADDKKEEFTTFNEALKLNIDDVYGISIFPPLKEYKNYDLNTIRKFVSELLNFNLIPIDKNESIQKPQNPSNGVYIGFLDKAGNRINAVFVDDGYIERGYTPEMSRSPWFTHRVEDIDAFTSWLNGYINLWGNSNNVSDENTKENSDTVTPPVEKQADILYKLGLFYGTGKGYELEKPVTRAEAITMVLRMIGEEQSATLSGYLKGFSDVGKSHWAYVNIGYAAYKGYINGTSETTFEPERGVTGREFVRMLLSAMGYKGITIENAYEEAIKYALLVNSYTKNAVSAEGNKLLRNDIVNICYSSLNAKTPDGKYLKDVLIEKGLIHIPILNH